MPNFCTQCGIQIFYEADVCNDCLFKPGRQTSPPNYQRPFAEQTPETRQPFSNYQTQPLDQPPLTHPIQPFYAATPQNLQNASACSFCGGSGGIMTKSNISAGGWIFMGIMFAIFIFGFLISAFTQCIPCAIIPFGLIFLGLLFKEKHFACVNCGQRVN